MPNSLSRCFEEPARLDGFAGGLWFIQGDVSVQLPVVRKRINWLLNAAVVLLVVVLVAVCLGLILSGAGDSAGSEAVRGLTYVALTVLVIDVLALLGHLTIAVVVLLERAESGDESIGGMTESDSKSSS
jgi:uncharacterized membrane protein